MRKIKMLGVIVKSGLLGMIALATVSCAWAQRKDNKQAIPISPPAVVKNSLIDQCVVGDWVAVNAVSYDQNPWTGGGGFSIKFTSAGTQTIDYTGMQPLSNDRGTAIYRGKVEIRFYMEDGKPQYEYGKDSWITQITGPYEVHGPTGLGGFEHGYMEKKYRCSETTLEYESPNLRYLAYDPSFKIVLKRLK